MPGRLDFDVDFGPNARRRDDAAPMRLLVVGDFSGTSGEQRGTFGGRATHRIDVDTFDAVMRRIGPRVALADVEIRFEQVDDFHPDRLYARLDRFKRLRDTRATTPPVPGGDQLARLLGTPPTPPAAAASGIDALIRDAVAPHVVKDTSAATVAHRQAVDGAIAEEMRGLLHAPAFQALEAAWRGVRWLVTSLELDDSLEVHLLDATRDELLADIVGSGGDLAKTGLHEIAVNRPRASVDGRRWTALVGLFRFGASTADVGLLAALGVVAARGGAAFLGDADPRLGLDPAGVPAEWTALRRTATARSIAMAAPRVLLRMPYGRTSDPIEAFGFEEFDAAPKTEQLLWASASLATALVVGRAFLARGWEMEPGDERDIDDLPAYVFEHDGERRLQPCAEVVLSERNVDAFVEAGLIPIAARLDRNGVVVVRFQSLADPPAPLAW
jgi:predicted component of type VI protein secretion system